MLEDDGGGDLALRQVLLEVKQSLQEHAQQAAVRVASAGGKAGAGRRRAAEDS